MRPGLQFSSTDRKDLERRGITLREAEQQLALLESPPPPIPLRRACRPGDGIAILAPEQAVERERAWDLAVENLRVVKFVPASGAATRMFSLLEKASESLADPSRRELARAAGRGDAAAGQVLELAERIEEMPFASALERLAIERSTTLADLKEWPLRLAALVAGAEGLGLASLPKGLVPFHSYDSRARSAFEEHLYEATGYAQGRDQLLALHFTVNREHLGAFQEATERAEPTARRTAGARFEIEFSIQDPSTDTLALAANGVPYRSSAGHLVFRPAGHGALITNLGRIDADVIFIKNIDNIAPAWRHQHSAVWKKRLGGHLLRLRTAISELLDRLERGDAGAAEDALSFCQDHLTLGLSSQITTEPPATLRAFLIERL
ncbi:MAG: DUF4301 family protein, partial [bacterium]|nr:DUF4301 family protein [bacterium]